MNNFIPVNEPVISTDDIGLVMKCLESGWISSEGPMVSEFEEKVASFANRHHAVSCVNGTAALELAFAALNIPEGKEVIIPSLTIISCLAPVLRNKLKPVFVDCDLLTFNSTPIDICSKVNSNTAAIICPHIYGLTIDLDPVLDIAKKNNIFVIEDAAESFGSFYKSKPCGSFGDISTLSFYPNKHITTGEGGMVLTDDEHLFQQLKYYRNLCFDNSKRFYHTDLGWNYRFTSLQAALGISQLNRLSSIMQRKKEVGTMYSKLLQSCTNIQLPLASVDYCENCYWVYPIVIKSGVKAEKVAQSLKDRNIGTRPFFYPLNKQPILMDYQYNTSSCPNSEFLYDYGMYIPSGLALTNQQIQHVADVLIDVVR